MYEENDDFEINYQLSDSDGEAVDLGCGSTISADEATKHNLNLDVTILKESQNKVKRKVADVETDVNGVKSKVDDVEDKVIKTVEQVSQLANKVSELQSQKNEENVIDYKPLIIIDDIDELTETCEKKSFENKYQKKSQNKKLKKNKSNTSEDNEVSHSYEVKESNNDDSLLHKLWNNRYFKKLREAIIGFILGTCTIYLFLYLCLPDYCHQAVKTLLALPITQDFLTSPAYHFIEVISNFIKGATGK